MPSVHDLDLARQIAQAWIARGRSVAPADRPATEAALSELLRQRRCPAGSFIWCGDPAEALVVVLVATLELLRAEAAARSTAWAGQPWKPLAGSYHDAVAALESCYRQRLGAGRWAAARERVAVARSRWSEATLLHELKSSAEEVTRVVLRSTDQYRHQFAWQFTDKAWDRHRMAALEEVPIEVRALLSQRSGELKEAFEPERIGFARRIWQKATPAERRVEDIRMQVTGWMETWRQTRLPLGKQLMDELVADAAPRSRAVNLQKMADYKQIAREELDLPLLAAIHDPLQRPIAVGTVQEAKVFDRPEEAWHLADRFPDRNWQRTWLQIRFQSSDWLGDLPEWRGEDGFAALANADTFYHLYRSLAAVRGGHQETPELAQREWEARTGYYACDVPTALVELGGCAGWWWHVPPFVILSERPCGYQQDRRGDLHSATGAAVSFASGKGQYFWHGVNVPEDLILRPESLGMVHLMRERNAEVRRCMVERIGMERLFTEADAVVVDRDSDGELLRIRLDGAILTDEPVVVVKVRCHSTGRTYFLRVPPQMTKVRQARAWTFGLDPKEFAPLVET